MKKILLIATALSKIFTAHCTPLESENDFNKLNLHSIPSNAGQDSKDDQALNLLSLPCIGVDKK